MDGSFLSPESENSHDVPSEALEFTCNICSLSLSTKRVGTPCDHIFYLPCLYQFLTNAHAKPFPICKTVMKCDTFNVIPMFCIDGSMGSRPRIASLGLDRGLMIPQLPRPSLPPAVIMHAV